MAHNNGEYFNPLIVPEEPEAYKLYREKAGNSHKEAEQLQSLCWEVFIVSPAGKKLMEIYMDKFVIPSKFLPTDIAAEKLSMYWHGYKDAIRGMKDNGLAHMRRISGTTIAR